MSDQREQDRRRALLAAHYDAENAPNIDRIMATFAEGAEMIYNGQHFTVADHIRWAHGYIGMSEQPGGLANIRTVRDREHYTDDEVIVEGRMLAKHTGEFQGFAPTGCDVVLPFVSFYRFDADGLLASERIVMNLGVLGIAGAALESERHSA
ncbi:MAG: nuclear transport factor 2 family protein [Candidatus Binatia bacterium]